MGAMSRASPTLVPPRLSGHRLTQRCRLLVRQRGVRPAGLDRLGIHAGTGTGVKARQDPAVAARVEQGEREALVAAGLLERVEPDETDSLERVTLGSLEHRLASDDLVELASDGLDPVEMRFQHRLEVHVVSAAGQRRHTSIEPADPSGKGEHRDEQDDGEDDETDDEGADIGLDERVEIDPENLRGGVASLAKRAHPERIRRLRMDAAAGFRALTVG